MRSPIKGLSSRLQKISLRIFLTHFQPLATPFDMILASFRPPAHPPFRDSDEEEENSYAVSERSPCQIAAQTAALPSRQSAHLCRETAPYPSAHHLPTIKTATPSIVGYQQKSLKGDAAYNLTVATFKVVGKEAKAMTLGDITASADWGTGSDEIKTLLANGAVDKAYTYITPDIAAEVGCPVGWYYTSDVNDESKLETIGNYCRNSDPLPLGDGLLVLVGSASTTLTYAGEVLTIDQPITLKGDAAYNITGNVTPVNITLGDITASADWGTGSDELKTLLANGAVDKAYTYITPDIAAEAGCIPGWYYTADVNDESKLETIGDYCKNSTPVAAGEAFLVLVGSSATQITVPTAL